MLLRFILVAFSVSLVHSTCQFHVTLFRQLQREGFHLRLFSAIEIVTGSKKCPAWSKCILSVVDTINSSFYVKFNKRSSENATGCTVGQFDIESSKDKSVPGLLYHYTPLKVSLNLVTSEFSFPLHLRYHPPQSGGGFTQATITKPTLLLSCEDKLNSNALVLAPCPFCSDRSCNWVKLPYKTNAANFTFSVPVGNSDDLTLVAFVTYTLALGGCIYLSLKVMEGRFYTNRLLDYEGGNVAAPSQLKPEDQAEISRIFHRLVVILEQNLSDVTKKKDPSVYTGTAGLAFLYLKLYEKDGRQELLLKANDLVEISLKGVRGRDVTFLCGDLGPLCIAAAIRSRLGDARGAAECVSTVLQFSTTVLDLTSGIPNELLYGRVGYVYCLLFLSLYIPNAVDPNLIKKVAETVVTAGKTKGQPPLMWEWHGKNYLGAAHGVAGILYMLLTVRSYLNKEHLELLRETLDYLLSIRFESGNLPSSLGSRDDRLIHWCHGAPGFVQTLLLAAEVWADTKYLEAAEKCGEVVWARGLLRKGYGICHGVAGNAYTFIALYQATGHSKHLHRAVQFAKWCGSYDQNQDHPPDRPYSLFEGLAGTVLFLNDVQDPLKAVFPGYSISPFKQLSFL